MEYGERTELIERSRVAVRQMRNATDIQYRIGIGGIKKLKNCFESYEEAMKALYATKGSVAHVDDLPIAVSYEDSYPVDLENGIFEKLSEGDVDGCLLESSKFFDWMSANFSDSIMDIRLKILEFVINAEHIMHDKGGNRYEFKSRTDYLPTVMGTEDLGELKKWFLDKIVETAQKIENNRADKSESLIEKAENYIKQNYMKDISLDDISRYCNISSYYFSKLFKQETGENYVEYLSGVRIENAKKMLSDSEASIKEISYSVGFSDPNYFSRAFKKYEGVSPTEYKDAL